MENRATAHLSSNQRERNIHFWEEEMSVSEIMLGIEAEGITAHATCMKMDILMVLKSWLER